MSALDTDLQLHLRRSQCIDAFVAIELGIANWQSRLCPGHETEMLKQKIARLRAVAASPRYSKKQRSDLHELLGEIDQIMPMRHDIVHGSLSVLKADGGFLAAFVNVREASALGSTARLFTATALEEVAARARTISGKLHTALDQMPVAAHSKATPKTRVASAQSKT